MTIREKFRQFVELADGLGFEYFWVFTKKSYKRMVWFWKLPISKVRWVATMIPERPKGVDSEWVIILSGHVKNQMKALKHRDQMSEAVHFGNRMPAYKVMARAMGGLKNLIGAR